jgi:hypothetical protein
LDFRKIWYSPAEPRTLSKSVPVRAWVHELAWLIPQRYAAAIPGIKLSHFVLFALLRWTAKDGEVHEQLCGRAHTETPRGESLYWLSPSTNSRKYGDRDSMAGYPMIKRCTCSICNRSKLHLRLTFVHAKAFNTDGSFDVVIHLAAAYSSLTTRASKGNNSLP